MESNPNPKSSPKAKSTGREPDRKDGLFISCWGRLKLMKSKLVPWNKRRAAGRRGARHHSHLARPATTSIAASLDCKSIADSLSVVQPRPMAAGGFKYDPLSYAQNFDEGTWHDHDLEAFQRGFSSRYAAPNLAPPPRPHPSSRSLIDE